MVFKLCGDPRVRDIEGERNTSEQADQATGRRQQWEKVKNTGKSTRGKRCCELVRWANSKLNAGLLTYC